MLLRKIVLCTAAWPSSITRLADHTSPVHSAWRRRAACFPTSRCSRVPASIPGESIRGSGTSTRTPPVIVSTRGLPPARHLPPLHRSRGLRARRSRDPVPRCACHYAALPDGALVQQLDSDVRVGGHAARISSQCHVFTEATTAYWPCDCRSDSKLPDPCGNMMYACSKPESWQKARATSGKIGR